MLLGMDGNKVAHRSALALHVVIFPNQGLLSLTSVTHFGNRGDLLSCQLLKRRVPACSVAARCLQY